MARAVLAGTTGSAGVAAGRLLWIAGRSDGPVRAEGAPRDPGAEEARLLAALDAAATGLEAVAAECKARAGEEVGAIFEAQAMFARDPAIVDAALAAVRSGSDAVAAIELAAAEQAGVLAALDDEYFRERAADVRDVGRRVVGHLTGAPAPTVHHADGTPAIVAGEDLDPSVVAVVRPELVAGLAMAGGAVNGHAAIVARALGIPLLLGLGPGLGAGFDGLDAVIDGPASRLIVEPSAAERAGLLAAAGPGVVAPAVVGPAATPVESAALRLPVRIEANVGSVREARQAASAGAEGIGLVRTELLFLGRSLPPGLGEQRSIYHGIRAAMPGRPVVFRTLDIGGDKPAEWAVPEREPNPALGLRGVRLGLSREELLETQLQAIVEVDDGETVDVMLPMLATLDEVRAARAVLERAVARSRAEDRPVAGDVRLGVMVEVPAAALLADSLAPAVDFFSIGTNDLVQYTMAADRTNPAVAGLASPFQPAVMRLVAMVGRAGERFGRPVAVCGEAAADPVAAALFVGLGVTVLSVAPSSIGGLRSSLAGLDLAACRVAAGRALEAPTADSVRAIGEALLADADARSAETPPGARPVVPA